MKWVHHLTIRARLIWMTVLCVLGVAVTGGVSFGMMRDMQQANASVTDVWMPMAAMSEHLTALVASYRVVEYRHVISPEREIMLESEAELERMEREIVQAFAGFDTLISSEDEPMLAQAWAAWEEYQRCHDELIAYSWGEDSIRARDLMMGRAFELSSIVYSRLEEAAAYNELRAQQEQERVARLYERMVGFLVLTVAGLCLLILCMAAMLTRSIRQPVQRMAQTARRVADGDLKAAFDFDSGDEMGLLCRSVEVLRLRLIKIIEDEKQYLDRLGREDYEAGSSCAEDYVGDFEPLLVSLDRLKEQLKRAKEQEFLMFLFRVLAERIDTVFIIYDWNAQRPQYVFSNAQRVLGIPWETLFSDMSLLFAHCELDGELEKLRAGLRTEFIEAPVQAELPYIRPDSGAHRRLKVTVNPARAHDGVPRYIIGLTDLTDELQSRQALHDALLGAQSASRAKSDFFSHMSHEIRTPLNAIIGMTTIASSAPGDQKRVEDCLSKIMLSSKHLLMLINDVLDMSRIESGKLSITRQPFRLEDLVGTVNTLIDPQAKANGQRFLIQIDPQVPCGLVGDELRVRQVLLNILSNSLKFTPKGGEIALRVELCGRRQHNAVWLRFLLSDTGCGMSEAFLQRLFLPFEQEADTKRQNPGGTGLGMAITHNLVELMGGSIQVKSAPGQGACFMVELPFARAKEIPASDFRRALEDLRALIVDDDPASGEHTKILFAQMGVRAEWVESGEQALRRIEQAAFDIALVDWRMQGMDGLETSRRIRERVGPGIMILIVSAYDWAPIEEEARLAGADGFIAKPLFRSTLLNTLAAATRREPPAEEPAAAEADFSGRRFLLAEDNELNREIAVELLRMLGAQADCAQDGQQAVDLFRESAPGRYDLILMDVQMPNKDGHTAAREIRALGRPDAQKIPIVALTANAFAEDEAAALGAGMDAHLSKPIDLAQLKGVLGRLLESGHRDSLDR